VALANNTALTGTPTAPTQPCLPNTNIATTAYVSNCPTGAGQSVTFSISSTSMDGVGATVVCAIGYTCSGASGAIWLNTGSSGITDYNGIAVYLNFSPAWTTTPICIFNSANGQSGTVTSSGISTTQAGVGSSIALTYNSSYTWLYICSPQI